MKSSVLSCRSLHTKTMRLALMIGSILLWSACQSHQESSPSPKTMTSKAEHTKVLSQVLSQQEYEVIYGEDDRQDVYALTNDTLRQRAQRSILAMINRDNLDESNPDNIQIFGRPLRDAYRLCGTQRFTQQMTASSCSTTLIDDRLLVTAGHCIESQEACEQQRFVLGYEMQDSDTLATITADQVFRCERLILSENNNSLDYAFVQLDRPVPTTIGEIAPINIDPVALTLNEPLVMMGFPSGLPLKVDDGGKVNNPREQSLDFFRATVDAFGGNSGSSVFNSLGEQVGILVRGETDYIPGGRRCNVVNELSDDRGVNDDAEEVTYLFRGIQALCDSGYPSERLCGQSQGGLCFNCELDTDCLDGYRCGQFANYPTAPTFCAPSCTDTPNVCPQGHSCIDEICTPTLSRRCESNRQVSVYDSCGRAIAQEPVCNEDTYCSEGNCIPIRSGNRCEDATVIDAVSQVLRGNLSQGYTNSGSPSCAGDGPDRFYRFTLDRPALVTATSTGFDTVLALYRDCQGNEVVCNDDAEPPGDFGSFIEANLEAGEYVLVLDAYFQEGASDYQIRFNVCQQDCDIGTQRCVDQTQIETCVQGNDCGSSWQIDDSCPLNTQCLDEGNQALCEELLEGDQCDNAIQLSDEDQRLLIDFRRDYTADITASCLGTNAKDIIYSVVLDQDQRLQVDANGVQAFSIMSSCENPSNETECTQSNAAFELQEEVRLNAGTHWIVFHTTEDLLATVDLRWLPICTQECSPNAQARCQEDSQGIEQCLVDDIGCFTWQETTPCTANEICIAALCLPNCFHQCETDEISCLNQSQPIECVQNERGCRVWERMEACATNEICAADGLCILAEEDAFWLNDQFMDMEIDVFLTDASTDMEIDRPDFDTSWTTNDSSEIILPSRRRGGCEVMTHKAGRQSPSSLWYALSWILMLIYTIKRQVVNAKH